MNKKGKSCYCCMKKLKVEFIYQICAGLGVGERWLCKSCYDEYMKVMPDDVICWSNNKRKLNEITDAQLTKLKELEKKQNEGRGVTCVRDIINLIEIKDFGRAIAVRQWDGDKTRSYPALEKCLTEIFGCRMHGTKKCKNAHCRSNR